MDEVLPNGNTAQGEGALHSLTTGSLNTANGYQALWSSTQAADNTAVGAYALWANTTGYGNTANGSSALLANTTGSENTASGVGALKSNTTGHKNTANGFSALYHNTIGRENTANGHYALSYNTTGFGNTANGAYALNENTTGFGNTANGIYALNHNTTGGDNTANGGGALFYNTTGNDNTANGGGALQNNTTGHNNIALGAYAGMYLTTGNNNIDIGNQGSAGDANTIRIGTVGWQTATFIAGISGATASGGVAVYVDASGHLGTLTSSERFKEDIQPMDKASETILGLQPVSFRYKHELDPQGIPQFGLVAEEVEKLNPDLVARDAQGKVYTVRYEAVNAMLLNEFLKEHRRVQELEATVAQQQKGLEALTAGLKEQEALIQKVSAKLEASKPAAQANQNNP